MTFTEWSQETDYEEQIIIKGFEVVRSDTAQITKDVQQMLFESVLEHDISEARELFYSYLRELITDIMNEDYDMNKLGRTFGIGQPLHEYGSADRTPQPSYRGAKFANKYLYETDAIGEGDRPKLYYVVEGSTGSHLRSTYGADTAEDGRYVDAISVLDWEDMPDDVKVDKPTMVQKMVCTPIESIINTLDWSMEEIDAMVESATPAEYYRDADQTGLDAADFW